MEAVAFLLATAVGFTWGYMWADARRQIKENRMYTTTDEVFSKVDWEGGLYEAAFGYGLSSEAIDKEALPDLHAAWVAMEDAHRAFEPAFERVAKMLEDVGEEPV